MKIINDKKSSSKIMISSALGVFCGFLTLFFMLAVFAFIKLKADLGETAANTFSTISLLASALVCGLISSKKLGSKLMLVAPFSGFIFYLIMVVVGLITSDKISLSIILLRFVLCVVFAGLGAVLGVLKKGDKNII